MNAACCSTCDGHASLRHSRCPGFSHNRRNRRPNFISGYTGKIPINLRWTGEEDTCEKRDFISSCREPVNHLYVVHPPQYLSDGTLELAKVRPAIPCPLIDEIAHHRNHPGSGICFQDPSVKKLPRGYEKVSQRAIRGGAICCEHCGCGQMFYDYRLMPPYRLDTKYSCM